MIGWSPPYGGSRGIEEEGNRAEATQNIGERSHSGEQRDVGVVRRGSKLCHKGMVDLSTGCIQASPGAVASQLLSISVKCPT